MRPFKQTNATDAIRAAQRERASYFNAVSWMTTRWLESMIDQGKMGNHWHIQYLYAQIEERFEELLTVRDKREAALRKLEWQVAPLNGDKSPLAEAQVEAGKALFNRIKNLKDAICHLGGAKFRGFAHCQIICNDLGQPVKLDPVEQYYFVQEQGKWGVRPNQGAEAIQIDPIGWIWRECARPIDEPASRRFIKVSLAEADYSGAVEDAGILALFLELPPNASPDQKAEFEKMAEYAINQLRAVVPSGTKLQTFGNTSGGSLNLFDEYLKRQEEKVIMLGTGGKLTVLASGGGLGDGGADVHDAAFDDLAINDAGHISEILHASLLEPWLRALFPGQEILAYFEIKAPDKSDVAALADTAVKVNALGHKVSAAWVTDNLGVEIEGPEVGGQKTEDGTPVLNSSKLEVQVQEMPTKDEATKALLLALGADMTPAFQALVEILNKETLSDADFTRALELCEAGGDAAVTDAWETFYTAGLLAGWAGTPE